ncbi:polysaccharide biosynthesis protein [Pseudomarimonas arenosa]|uniref:Polysaccharide biosynthesis protein n=1 Tax=Pseudomarimonas arenosa TaxID=2774145 RepID=A0AAW3ZFB5_9GAMM|nr:nucleoside-diphosphate sugar epimerase/dehydratase [Pseudomarimonas arenosa]MBD8524588.1 polysaccharide biosynthesis protein [Pseudomarimonas arenosa]
MRTLGRWVALIHPRVAVVIHDLTMVWLAWIIASRLREPRMVPWWSDELWVVLIAQGLVFWRTGLYRGLWRFASLPDLWNIARGAAFGTLGVTLGLVLLSRLEGISRGVLALYPFILLVLLGTPRMMYRYWKDSRYGGVREAAERRVLILGAGRAGEILVRDLHREGRFKAVGFLDDNRALRGARIHGVPVLGGIDKVREIANEVAAEMLLIAIPGASNAQMQRVVELCEASELPFRTVPRLRDVVEGRSSFAELKEVAIEDLLGREPVELDWSAIRLALAGKRVLVTGGGGSIGSELCRQIARLGVERLTVLDLSEYNLYRCEQELRGAYPDVLIDCILGDVGDAATVDHVLELARPQLVFHAAAFKHVPILQNQVREAVRNNVLSTYTLAQACVRRDVESFVLVSSDKAVNPANVMGASKRWAELVCQSMAQTSPTRFVTVRFGNVLDSAGSVVPLFREQIRNGGPVTVTHPEITRYFMTIPEACQLILQAMTLGQGGELFALDMGEPVKIRYLAEQMIRLGGKVPDRDIAIIYTGLRPGEKLFEEIFHAQESYSQTSHPKIWLAQSRPVSSTALEPALQQAAVASRKFDQPGLDKLLAEWVPEYRPAAGEGTVLPFQRNVS